MTAPEEAERLVYRYYYLLYEMQPNPKPREVMAQAKECALICMGEMLEEVITEDYSYWKKVNQEIIKL